MQARRTVKKRWHTSGGAPGRPRPGEALAVLRIKTMSEASCWVAWRGSWAVSATSDVMSNWPATTDRLRPHGGSRATVEYRNEAVFAVRGKSHPWQSCSARDVPSQMTGVGELFLRRGHRRPALVGVPMPNAPRCGPPGLRSFEAACAPPFIASLASYAGSQGTGPLPEYRLGI
jgi:hypothetical protein